VSILRRSVTILLVTAMLATGFAGIASAAIQDVTGTRFEEAVTYLNRLGVLEGRPGGFYPNEPITRAEAAKIIVYIIGKADLADLVKGSMPFSDVPGSHWASGYILIAKNLGIINGYPGGTFKPENNVTYSEFAKLLVEAAGLSPTAGQTWPLNYIMAAQAAGILADVPGFAAALSAIRGDCAIMGATTVKDVRNPSTGLTLAQSVFGESLVTTIEVTPGTTTVSVGVAVNFTVVAKDEEGQVVSDATPTWTTTTPTKAVITNTGRFTATAAGIYTVSAKIGTVTGTATVNVYGLPTALKATIDKTSLPANGVSQATITVEVVDANGVKVPTATNEIAISYYDSDGAVTLPDETTMDAVAGVATFVVTATSLSGETDVLQFKATGLTTAKVSVKTVAQVAKSIGLTADPTQLIANETNYGIVTATILDQEGEQMLFGVYTLTFSISGDGLLEGDTDPVQRATIDQQTIVDVSSEAGDPGSFTITARATGLTTKSISISTYIAGAPKSIRVTAVDTNGETGIHDEDMEITVWLADSKGKPAPAEEGIIVEFVPPTDSGLVGLGDLVFNVGESTKTVKFNGTKSGTFKVTVRDINTDDPAVSSTSFSCTVTATYVGGVDLTPTGDPQIWVSLTNPKVSFTAQLTDGAGNKVKKSGIKLKFTATKGGTAQGTYTWSTTGGIVTTDANGLATITFTGQGYVGNTYTIHCDGDRDGDGAYDDFDGSTESAAIYVSDRLPDDFAISVTDGVDPISLIEADDADIAYFSAGVLDSQGNPIEKSGMTVRVSFGSSGRYILTDSVSGANMDASEKEDGIFYFTTDSDGEIAFSFQGGRAGSYSITASCMNVSPVASRSKTFSTVAGETMVAVRVLKTDNSLAENITVVANRVYQFKVGVVDNGGNLIGAPTDMSLDLTPDRGTGEYRLTSTGSEITTIEFAEGNSNKTVYYVDSVSASGDDAIDLWDDVSGWDT